MKILSLFDGISCARVALERAGIPVEAYYASEVDKYAMQISGKNYPDIVQVGSVVGLDTAQFTDIDLLIGGSPCQDLSIAKKDRKGLDGSRSGLFWEYVRIRNEVKPKYFILENVNSMPKEAKAVITEALGVEPVMIDAALVSAQRRKRLFWVGKWNGEKYEQVVIPHPEDRGILLKDILEDVPTDAPIKEKSKTVRSGGRGSGLGDKHEWDSVYQYRRTYWRETKGGKVPTLTANMGTGGNNVPYVSVSEQVVGRKRQPDGSWVRQLEPRDDGKSSALTSNLNRSLLAHPELGIRKLTPLECERLQSLDGGYTEGVSNTQRYKALGNGFNCEVVKHILVRLFM
jgi:DNA-cytosine methyltransferase